MGGKGRKRREKNYRAAHGGPARLPPPPDTSKLDAFPSKLRRLISFTSSPIDHDPSEDSKDAPRGKRIVIGDGDSEKKRLQGNERMSKATGTEDGDDDGHLVTQQEVDSGDEIIQNNKNEKKKKKRKRKEVNDLRFEALDGSAKRSKRKERKKKYLEAKKNKNKKPKTEVHFDFPGRETIKFGEVVEAPPKLVSFPKAFKTDASKERLRLQAVESYRNRKGWSSRPGLQLPLIATAPSL